MAVKIASLSAVTVTSAGSAVQITASPIATPACIIQASKANSGNIAVIFTTNNARIKRIPADQLSIYKKRANVAVNPDLTLVRKLPPHFWKKPIFGNRIQPKTKFERAVTERHQKLFGVSNKIENLNTWKYWFFVWLKRLIGSAIIALGAYFWAKSEGRL